MSHLTMFPVRSVEGKPGSEPSRRVTRTAVSERISSTRYIRRFTFPGEMGSFGSFHSTSIRVLPSTTLLRGVPLMVFLK